MHGDVAPGYKVLVIFEEVMEAPVQGAIVGEVGVVYVQGTVLLVEDGDGMHEVQHVGGEAIILQLHDCAGPSC